MLRYLKSEGAHEWTFSRTPSMPYSEHVALLPAITPQDRLPYALFSLSTSDGRTLRDGTKTLFPSVADPRINQTTTSHPDVLYPIVGRRRRQSPAKFIQALEIPFESPKS